MDLGFEVFWEAVLPEDHSGTGFVRRALRALRFVPAPLRAPSATVVLGLGAPHMLLLAARLSRSAAVIFDACDSWLLQTRARWREGARVSALVPLAGTVVAAFAGRRLRATYISERDAHVDARWLRSSVSIVPQVVDADVLALAVNEVRYPLDRVVAPADLRSFHNLRGIEALARASEALSRDGKEIPCEIQVFSSTSGIDSAISGLRNMGHADALAAIYEGNTGVFIANAPGSGLPNKVLEAVSAKRPVLLTRELADSLPRIPGLVGVAVDSLDDLPAGLLKLTMGDVSELAIKRAATRHAPSIAPLKKSDLQC